MHAIDLLAELLHSATVKVTPRLILGAGGVNDLRHGRVGKVQGVVLGDGGEMTLLLECNNATVKIDLEGETAFEAVKALAALPCVFPEKFRRKDVQRERIQNDSRDGADLSLLGRFGK